MRAPVAAALLAVACSGPVKKDTTPAFTPAPRLGAEPAAPQDLPGRAWLEEVHARFHERWADTFLEQSRQYLPPAHPLNDPRLEVVLRLTVDGKGNLKSIDVVRASGNADFDGAAREVAGSVSPLPPPAEELRSDDGDVYLDWLFARDVRQDAVAGARVDRRRWELDKAIPALARAGRLGEAASRVAEAASPMPKGDGAVRLVALGRQAAGAALVAALADDQEPAVRIEAAQAAGLSGIPEMIPLLRRLAESAPDLELQAAALLALGRLGDADSLAIFEAALARLDGGRATAAARALVALGRAGSMWEALAPRLAGDARARGQVLAILADVGAPPAAAAALTALVADKRAARGDRADGARALGAAATDPAGPAAKALAAALGEPDASVRAAAAEGLAEAGARGARSRALFFAVLELFKDRDPRARAAAILAAARLSGKDAVGEIVLAVAKSKDPTILAAGAQALAEIPLAEALPPLLKLAGSAIPDVRFAALRGLGKRREPEAQAALAKLAADADPRVREIATAVLEPAEAEAALADPAPEVRAAALGALVARGGATAALAPAMRALAAATTPHERVLLARAFLEGTHAR